ncbi:hypothetical protein KC343_g3187 [Hortaea werneckii]|uniref:2EXR domain-containing protein n=1 Tax=Hortaea werneckii TaxID=91943 RepID=A0A3M7G6M2_HORWE|nr:hypothetical protein KC352_g16068 [Hortaea werneckii]KAI7571563.1 hypothetical protein KC317_g1524 [Hortaea werneckii]KAI7617327.1 hypothetical protein KC346_g5542 [Hortaea werneckii]KAI7632969.1 hypothetical protein KC343_g3187 [Hortaea werneckii]KAI7682098.1 hypothetical protein KC319_g1197 [Hortaea werneckii]
MTPNSRKRQAPSDGTDANVNPRPRKRATLAASHHTPPSVRQIQARNNRDSPFLRLPPEIRNRIYDLALGNRVIHVTTKECSKTDYGAYPGGRLFRRILGPHNHYVKFLHVVCHEPVDAEELIYRNSMDLSQPKAPCYGSRHKDCYSLIGYSPALGDQPENTNCADRRKQATQGLTMGLTRVSRDIHRETALIPYANNTFSFHKCAEMDLFVTKILLAPQRAAIKTIQIYGYGDAIYRHSGITGQVAKVLTGLHTLRINLPGWILKTKGQNLCRMFGKGFETLRVICEDNNYHKFRSNSKEELRKLAEQIEKELMKRA